MKNKYKESTNPALNALLQGRKRICKFTIKKSIPKVMYTLGTKHFEKTMMGLFYNTTKDVYLYINNFWVLKIETKTLSKFFWRSYPNLWVTFPKRIFLFIIANPDFNFYLKMKYCSQKSRHGAITKFSDVIFKLRITTLNINKEGKEKCTFLLLFL